LNLFKCGCGKGSPRSAGAIYEKLSIT